MNIRDIVQTITGKKKALGVELWKELFRTGVQADYKAGVNADSKSISIIKGLTDAGADVTFATARSAPCFTIFPIMKSAALLPVY